MKDMSTSTRDFRFQRLCCSMLTFLSLASKVFLKRATSACFGLAGAFLAASALGNVIVPTVPEQDVFVADGRTEYKIEVRADTTAFPDEKFRRATWAFYIPDGLEFTFGQIPDPINNPSRSLDDFFFDFLMDDAYNYVDVTPSNGGVVGWQKILGDNTRGTMSVSDGPANVNDKVVGEYMFKVSPIAVRRETNAMLSAVSITDTTGLQYKVSNHNLTIENQKFRIVDDVRADFTGEMGKRDGRVNAYDSEVFEACSTGPGISYDVANLPAGCEVAPLPNGKMPMDFDEDGDVDQSDFGVFQRCLSGDEVASENCAD